MKRVLMYASQSVFHERKTGGTKRFGELYRYLRDNYLCDLCSEDNAENIKLNHAKQTFHIVNKKTILNKFITREMLVPLYNRKTFKDIKKSEYDTIISFDVPPTVCLCNAGVKNVVLMVRRDFLGYEKVTNVNKSFRRKIKRLGMWITEDICMRKCSKIIVQCEYDKEILILRHKRLRKKIEPKIFTQINNINPSWVMKPQIMTDPLRIINGAFNICFIGNFDDNRKGHDILLEAASNMNDLNVVIHIIGGGKQLAKYREKYKNENLVFYGHISSPFNIMMQCDMVIVPSKADSCPNTVLEALYYGIPVIACNTGGIPEILHNGNAVFNPNAQAIERAVRHYVENIDDLEKLKSQQLKRSHELTFDWAQKMSELILA